MGWRTWLSKHAAFCGLGAYARWHWKGTANAPSHHLLLLSILPLQLRPVARALEADEFALDAASWGAAAEPATEAELADLHTAAVALRLLLPDSEADAAAATARLENFLGVLDSSMRSACWEELLQLLREAAADSSAGEARAAEVHAARQAKLSALAVVLSNELGVELQAVSTPAHRGDRTTADTSGASSCTEPPAVPGVCLVDKALAEYAAYRRELLVEGPTQQPGTAAGPLAANDFPGVAQLYSDAWAEVAPDSDWGLLRLFGKCRRLQEHAGGISGRLGSYFKGLAVHILPPSLQPADLACAFAPEHVRGLVNLDSDAAADAPAYTTAQAHATVEAPPELQPYLLRGTPLDALLHDLPSLAVKAVAAGGAPLQQDGPAAVLRGQVKLSALWLQLALAVAEALDTGRLAGGVCLRLEQLQGEVEEVAHLQKDIQQLEAQAADARLESAQLRAELGRARAAVADARTDEARYRQLDLFCYGGSATAAYAPRSGLAAAENRVLVLEGDLARSAQNAVMNLERAGELRLRLQQHEQQVKERHVARLNTCFSALKDTVHQLSRSVQAACGLPDGNGAPSSSAIAAQLLALDVALAVTGSDGGRQPLAELLPSLHAASAAAARQLADLGALVEASFPAALSAGRALLHAGKLLAAGTLHLTSSSAALLKVSEREEDLQPLAEGGRQLALELEELVQPLLQLQPPPSSTAVVRAVSGLCAQLESACSGGVAATVASLVAAAEQGVGADSAAASSLQAVRSFLARLTVAATRSASLADPNDPDLAALWSDVRQRLAAACGGDSGAALAAADRLTLQAHLERCADELPCMLEALRCAPLAAAFGFVGNPVALAEAAEGHMERLGSAFLEPSYLVRHVHKVLTRLVGSHLEAAEITAATAPVRAQTTQYQSDDDAVGSLGAGSRSTTAQRLLAVVRSLEPVAHVNVADGGDAYLAAVSCLGCGTVYSSGPPALEQLDLKLKTLIEQLLTMAPMGQSSQDGGAAPQRGLASAAERMSLLRTLLLQSLFTAGVGVVSARFFTNSDRCVSGVKGVSCFRAYHTWPGTGF